MCNTCADEELLGAGREDEVAYAVAHGAEAGVDLELEVEAGRLGLVADAVLLVEAHVRRLHGAHQLVAVLGQRALPLTQTLLLLLLLLEFI